MQCLSTPCRDDNIICRAYYQPLLKMFYMTMFQVRLGGLNQHESGGNNLLILIWESKIIHSSIKWFDHEKDCKAEIHAWYIMDYEVIMAI